MLQHPVNCFSVGPGRANKTARERRAEESAAESVERGGDAPGAFGSGGPAQEDGNVLKRFAMIFVLAIMAGFGPAPRFAAAKAQKPKTDEAKNQCVECHKNDKVKKTEYVSHSFADWAQSPHGKSGVTCEACHGGQPTETDPSKAHQGVLRSTKSDSPVYYKNLPEPIGTRRADFVVEGKVLVELKAIIALERVHLAQAMNYLEAYNMEIGLLINFGNPRLEYKRFTRTKDYQHG